MERSFAIALFIWLAAAASPLLVGPAMAGGVSIPRGDVYLTVRSGLGFPDDQKYTGAVVLENDFDSTNWHIGGAVGYALEPVSYGRWRVELETVRFNDDVDTLLINGMDTPFMGDSMVNTIMFNTYLDFVQVGGKAIPYVGVGLGGAQIYPQVRYAPFMLYDKAKAVAYQFMAGLYIPLSEHWSIQTDVRYLGTGDAKLDRVFPDGRQRLSADYQTLVVAGGITFAF